MGRQIFESKDEVSLVDPKKSNVGNYLFENVLKAVRNQNEAYKKPLKDDEENDQKKTNILINEALWKQVIYHKPVTCCQNSKDKLANRELLSLHIDLRLDCLCLVSNWVEILCKVIFDDAPNGRN